MIKTCVHVILAIRKKKKKKKRVCLWGEKVVLFFIFLKEEVILVLLKKRRYISTWLTNMRGKCEDGRKRFSDHNLPPFHFGN